MKRKFLLARFSFAFNPNLTNDKLMNKIIEEIIKLIPFGDALTYWGVGKEWIAGLVSVILTVIFYFVGRALKKWQAHRKNKKTAKDLFPYYNYQKVKEARDLFIPTQGQNNSPNREDEVRTSTKFAIKNKLIPWFINTAFNEKEESDKYYLVLAGSGMGKQLL